MTKAWPRLCLIAEDEPLIGMDLEEAVGCAGYEPLWFVSMERALASLDDGLPDVAIIDVQLRDGPCTELALRLKRHGVPFIVHSALPADECSSDLAVDVPWLTKPAERSAVLSALAAVLQRG